MASTGSSKIRFGADCFFCGGLAALSRLSLGLCLLHLTKSTTPFSIIHRKAGKPEQNWFKGVEHTGRVFMFLLRELAKKWRSSLGRRPQQPSRLVRASIPLVAQGWFLSNHRGCIHLGASSHTSRWVHCIRSAAHIQIYGILRVSDGTYLKWCRARAATPFLTRGGFDLAATGTQLLPYAVCARTLAIAERPLNILY